MMRSRFGRALPTASCSLPALPDFAGRALEAAASGVRAIACLATMPPCDHGTKTDLQTAEPEHQKRIAVYGGHEQGNGAYKHKAEAHNRNDAYRKCATGDDGRSVEQQPEAGQHAKDIQPVEDDCEDRASQQWGHETEQRTARGSRLQRKGHSL